MCGIVGYVGSGNATNFLIDGLRRLEYRGYDSAGIAVYENGKINIEKKQGRLVNLENELKKHPLQGHIGIGHTRWATHGKPSDRNAHPHGDCHNHFVVVHNGIIENYLTLKKDLMEKGHVFKSETEHGSGSSSSGRARRWQFPFHSPQNAFHHRRLLQPCDYGQLLS